MWRTNLEFKVLCLDDTVFSCHCVLVFSYVVSDFLELMGVKGEKGGGGEVNHVFWYF